MPTTAEEYRATIIAGRTNQLKTSARNIARLQASFDAAANNIIDAIEALPDDRIGTPWVASRLRTINYIGTVLETFESEYADLLEFAMLASAQDAADLQTAVDALLDAPIDPALRPSLQATITLSGGNSLALQYGRIASGAVEYAAARYYSDGLVLSDRLYNITEAFRKTVENTVVTGLTEAASSKTIGRRLESALAAAGSDNPRYHAMRIARTEVNIAHRESAVLSALDANGNLKPYVQGIKWELSASHPRTDICDAYASYDTGLGPGVYYPGGMPVDHPHGLCWTYPLLKDYTDFVGPGRTPAPLSEVPIRQLTYAAEHGDTVAAGIIAQINAAAAEAVGV